MAWKTCSLACLLLLCSLAKGQEYYLDVLHYRFQLRLSDSNNIIHGHAKITIRLQYASFGITLDLAHTMHCSAVRSGGRPAAFGQGEDQLFIILPEPGKAGDTASIDIDYAGIPADGLIIDKNKFGHRTFFGDNWPARAHHWLPCHDDPSDKASVEFIVTAPQHYQVVSNGIQVAMTVSGKERTTHWREDKPLPTKIMVIGVADFAVQLAGKADDVPVYSWVYPEDRDKGFYDYAQATAILPFFTRAIAPFPFRKLANVESTTIFGGMENAGAIFYSERSVTGNRSSEALLAHEIAHQWFGDMATEASWPHLWLSEGFATYLSMLYLENKYGTDTLQYQLRKSKEKIFEYAQKTLRPVVDTAQRDYMQLLNANSYDKGAWVLHMLRRQLGDTVFWRSMRAYYARYAGKNAVTDDLRKVFEEVSGRDLRPFFRQWLFTAGHPVLHVSWVYDSRQQAVTGTVVQEQASPFEFPLELSLYVQGEKGPLIWEIKVKDRITDFSVPVKRAVSSLVMDPDNKLLYEEGKRK